MKNFMKQKTILLFIILTLFTGCSDDDFTDGDLYQSQWEGKLQYIDKGKEKECDIIITFDTESTGRYIAENLEENSEYSKQSDIEYQTVDNIIRLYGGIRSLVWGDWWVVKSSNKELLLKKEPGTEYESVLILNKKRL